MIEWYRIDKGNGRPLLLFHGGGNSSRVWEPIVDLLAEHRRAIALDFPGFGRTPFPEHGELTPDWYIRELTSQLATLGIKTPVDIAGNSMGGWFALEAAKAGLARSVVALGPAGLWRNGMPPLLRSKFRTGLIVGRMLRGHEEAVTRTRIGRTAALSMLVTNIDKVPPTIAAAVMRDLDESRGTLMALLGSARSQGFTGGRAITVPITVAWSDGERMLHPRSARVRDELPAHTRWIELPGCGHIPTWDAPELIARTILEGTA